MDTQPTPGQPQTPVTLKQDMFVWCFVMSLVIIILSWCYCTMPIYSQLNEYFLDCFYLQSKHWGYCFSQINNHVCGTRDLFQPSNCPVSANRACSLILTHSSHSDIKPEHNAMGSEQITLTWLLWHAVSHIFQYLEVELTVNVTFVFRQVLCCLSQTHTQKCIRSLSGYEKSTLCECYTWFLFSPRAATAVAFLFSGTHVERWYVWILNRTPQRIPNWEHGVVVGGSFIFTFYSAKKYTLANNDHSLRTVQLCWFCLK